MVFDKFISKVLSNDKRNFNEVCVDNKVIDSVIYYAKESYPNEFLAFFDGHVKDNKLILDSLLFLPGETSNTGATFNEGLMPPSQRIWGTVHSHPGPSAQPSNADLMTFSKHGLFHMIICLPYEIPSFCAYDAYGDSVKYTLGDYDDKNQDAMLDDLQDLQDEIGHGYPEDYDFSEDDSTKEYDAFMKKYNEAIANNQRVIYIDVNKLENDNYKNK
ncbi:Mov34/MPN/PAD-1 family protein [Methanobrevibacter sp. UBA313]|jgi:proteasome lid subunit RPN8/RPN11|uniref:Mov34/MPN/PAD-1 family protein n=1 Tax=Methanobrevibacter sp. UBA313 TaxID=1915477 RepID=UPI0039B931C2